jgi:hypothetical protein
MILMEQRAAVHFFILKDINPGDIRTELASVHEIDAFDLQILYK